MTAQLDLSQFLRPGDRIVWGQACGEPTTLVEALIAQAEQIGGLSAFTATSFSGILDTAAAHKVALSSMGAIGALRTLTEAHRLSIIPCHVSQVGPLIEQGLIGCDVAFVQVSPADAEGNHSFGLINDFIHAAVAKARVVIAEVNDQVPFTYGDVMLRAEQIDHAVHVSRTPVEVTPAKITQTDQPIARNVARYIDDGAVIQIGIGAVPDAILRLLHDRRDLGVHSGMLGDGFVDLVEAGVVTNARKPIDVGISVTTALIGTKRLYQYAHRNKQIALRSSQLHARRQRAVALAEPRHDQLCAGSGPDEPGECGAERRALCRRHRRASRLRARRQPFARRALDHRASGHRQGRQDQPHRSRRCRAR